MYQKSCVGSCNEADSERDHIVIKEISKTNLADVDFSDFDIVRAGKAIFSST
jgi:hypothetical protein